VAIALGGKALVPIDKIHIEVIVLHPAHQGVIENKLLVTSTGFQPHQVGQGGENALAGRLGQGRMNHAAEGVVSRATAGTVDTPEPHNYR
jgi:hypothetical protein